MSALMTQLRNQMKRQEAALAATQQQMKEVDMLPPTDNTNTLRHRISLRINRQSATLDQTKAQLRELEQQLLNPPQKPARTK